MKSSAKKKIRIAVSLVLAISHAVAALFCFVSTYAFLKEGVEMAGFSFVCGVYVALCAVIWGYEVHRALQEKHYVLLSGLMMDIWALFFMLGFAYIPLHIPAASGFFFVLAFLVLGIILFSWFGFVKYPDRKQEWRNTPLQNQGLWNQAWQDSRFLQGMMGGQTGQRGMQNPGMQQGNSRGIQSMAAMAYSSSFMPPMQQVGKVRWEAASVEIPVYAEPGVAPDYIQVCAEHLAGLNKGILKELAERIYKEMHVAEYERMIGTNEISQNLMSVICLSCPDRMNIFRPEGTGPAFTVGGEPIFQHDFGMAFSVIGNRIVKVGYRNDVEPVSPWRTGGANNF